MQPCCSLVLAGAGAGSSCRHSGDKGPCGCCCCPPVWLAAVDVEGLEHVEHVAQAHARHCQAIVVHVDEGLGAQHHHHTQQQLGQHPAAAAPAA